MKLGIDLDDVVIDINYSIRNYINKIYNTNVTLEDHVTFDFHTTWNCTPVEAMNRVFEFYDSPHMEKIRPLTGAIDTINILRSSHEIHFVTSRPNSIKEKTRAWIDKHFPDSNLPVHHTN